MEEEISKKGDRWTNWCVVIWVILTGLVWILRYFIHKVLSPGDAGISFIATALLTICIWLIGLILIRVFVSRKKEYKTQN